MASGYAFGYMLAVPVPTTLTEGIHARLVLLWAFVLTGAGSIAMVIACLRCRCVGRSLSPDDSWDFKPVLANREALGYTLDSAHRIRAQPHI
jgi:hypothetical protein